MKRIAVYGSLRIGMHNHRLLETGGATFVGRETLNVPYKMIPYSSFPALIPSEHNNDIVMELYDVDDEVYRNVEMLEGYPHFYDKDTVMDSSNTPVEYYIIPDKENIMQERYADVDSISDWVQFLTQR